MPVPRTAAARLGAVALLLCSLIIAAEAAASRPTAAQDGPGPVRGFLDAHSHLHSHESFGGMLLCGKPFDPDGIQKALHDCIDHYPGGELAFFENFLRNGSPFGTHDPKGWPTFKDWPAWNSLTHQTAYHEWVERAWRGGQRILVNHMVANRQLCEVYPLKRTSCDEMTSIRLQIRRAHELQDYIDSLHGGPGKGWLRIVRSPEEARQAIAQGKLAMVLGVETSEPFGCRIVNGTPGCTETDIDRGLDELHALGVRSMFLCHKFDNALCGVRFDGGVQGLIVNAGNKLGTGKFWQAETCTTAEHDNTVTGGTLPKELSWIDPGGAFPLYPPAPHCNKLGLTDLGEHMLRGMMRRNMWIEIDHMSVRAAARTLDILEQAGYPRVISSHSWTDPGFYPRIYRLGGMVASYGHGSEEFVRNWRAAKAVRDPSRLFGYGYGMDANGLGPLPPPRAGNAANPVRYPFTSHDGSVTLDRLRTGERTWDVNVDGVANYGLIPDWIEDMRILAGREIVDDLAWAAEAYLRAWEAPPAS